jgi:hypothetical protein
VADVSYCAGNSCDNLGDSLCSGCNNNGYLDVVALVTADVDQDANLCLERLEELGGWSAGLGYSGKGHGSTVGRGLGY